MDGVFQSLFDCFSIRVWAFIQKYISSSSLVIVCCCPFVTIFNALTWSIITIFSTCLKIEQSLPKVIISSKFASFTVENRDNVCCNRKGLFWHYIFWKSHTWDFFQFSAKTVLFALGHIFSKVNSTNVKKPDAVGT